jgi:TolB protein
MREYVLPAVFFIFLFSVTNAQTRFVSVQNPSSNLLITFSSDATENDKQQIFTMDINGDDVKKVCFGELDCYAPRFSPDGKKIVYSATNIVSDYIYMVDLDDSATIMFPKFVDGGSDPVFSPDGKYLLYRSEKNLDNAIYILDLRTDSSFMINDGSLSTHAEFSPDGSKIIYSSSLNENFDIVVLDLYDTTDNAQRVIAGTPDAELYGTFSPDGSTAAYASFNIYYKGTIHLCNLDGSSNIAISKGMGSSYNPKFSPDGTKLAFVSDKTGKYEVYVYYIDGSGIRQLTNKNGDTIEFDWSPDSRKIVFESMRESVSSINVIDVETGETTNLTGEKANNINPCFQKISLAR